MITSRTPQRAGALLALAGILAFAAAFLPGAGRAAAVPLDGTVAITAGDGRSCALTEEARAKCWGAAAATLPDGHVCFQAPVSVWCVSPADVLEGADGSPLRGVAQVSSGAGNHACARIESGGVKCWGANNLGQLGDGTFDRRHAPAEVVGLGGPTVDIAVGRNHTCALRASGAVVCWGDNDRGGLGAQTDKCFIYAPDPVPLEAEPPPDHIAVPCSFTPVEVQGLDGQVAAIEAGRGHTCALMADGGVKCWGDLGTGEQPLPGAERCEFIFVFYTCATTTPLAVCEQYGGDGETCLQPLSGAVALAAGWDHTCALTVATTVKCWGMNGIGQLGNGEEDFYTAPPSEVCADTECSAPLIGVESIGAGAFHTCAVMQSGGVKCWGDNHEPGQLGDNRHCGLTCPTPTDVCVDPLCESLLTGAAGVDGGFDHTCAVMEGGGAYCWGGNFWGQLGVGVCCFDYFYAVQVCEPVSSVDASLVLQLVAALIDDMPCKGPADMDRDGELTSIDAALILQRVAGLI